QKHPFHRRPPSSTDTVVSLPSRAKRSADGLSARYDWALASAAASGLAFFRSSGESPRMPVVAMVVDCELERPPPHAPVIPERMLPPPEGAAACTLAGKRRWK